MSKNIKLSPAAQLVTGSFVVVGGTVALGIDFINNTEWASHIGATAMASAAVAAIGVAAFQGLEVLNGRNRLTTAGKWASLIMTVTVAALAYIGGMGDKMNADAKVTKEYATALTNAAKGRAQADRAREQAAAYRKQAAEIKPSGSIDALKAAVANAEAELKPFAADAESKGTLCAKVTKCRTISEKRDAATTALGLAQDKASFLTQAAQQDATANEADAKASSFEAKAESGHVHEDVIGMTLATLIGGTAWGWAIGIDVILAMLQIAVTQVAAMHIETGAAMIANAFTTRQEAKAAIVEAAAKEAAKLAKAEAKALKDAEKAKQEKAERAAATRAANKAKKTAPAAEKPRLTVVANDNTPQAIRA